MKKIYKGRIEKRTYGDNWSALFISDNPDEPLAERVEADLEAYGRYATVRYYISATEKSLDELEENLIRKISGDLEAEYSDAYSDYTGYLWTDQDLKVGGHDLLNELSGSQGLYAYIEIEFSEEAPNA